MSCTLLLCLFASSVFTHDCLSEVSDNLTQHGQTTGGKSIDKGFSWVRTLLSSDESGAKGERS